MSPFSLWKVGNFLFRWQEWQRRKRLETSGGLFDDAIDSMFSTFSLSGISDFIQNDVIADAASMLGDVADAFRMVDSGVSAAMRLLQGICLSF
ncbi:DNA circulation family protein [Salmonella enterica subsp. enterica serovar Typhimurium]|nr:DNA circulation family protein [Salmonella enterica subsp. enterica serovar Typhimurium]